MHSPGKMNPIKKLTTKENLHIFFQSSLLILWIATLFYLIYIRTEDKLLISDAMRSVEIRDELWVLNDEQHKETWKIICEEHFEYPACQRNWEAEIAMIRAKTDPLTKDESE